MYLNDFNSGGGGDGDPTCLACKQPIGSGQPRTHVAFNHDPHGHKGYTGDYHRVCSKPFVSIAHILNMNPLAR